MPKGYPCRRPFVHFSWRNVQLLGVGSCPDWAEMCKHVAAVLYGVGARLDARPELLFELRGVDGSDLTARAGKNLPLARKGPPPGRLLVEEGLSELFGLDLAEVSVSTMPQGARPGKRRARSR